MSYRQKKKSHAALRAANTAGVHIVAFVQAQPRLEALALLALLLAALMSAISGT